MNEYYHHMMDYGYGGVFMWILFVLLIIALVYAIVLNFRFRNSETLNEKPMDILKKRYARGEITKEEFEKVKEDLK